VRLATVFMHFLTVGSSCAGGLGAAAKQGLLCRACDLAVVGCGVTSSLHNSRLATMATVLYFLSKASFFGVAFCVRWIAGSELGPLVR